MRLKKVRPHCAPLQTRVLLLTCHQIDLIAAYNLLIHLINQSPNVQDYLQPICGSLTSLATPADSTPASSNRLALALSVLTTIFNTIPPTQSVRLPVFISILDAVQKQSSSTYETLRAQLTQLESWLGDWKASPASARRLYAKISTIAREAGEQEDSYTYLVKALRTFPGSESGSEDAHRLAVQALRQALTSNSHFDFEDLTALDAVQNLRQSEPVWFQLLELFTSDNLEEYVAFKSENPKFLQEANLSDEALTRKMRLLTLASLAASASQTRQLPYASIAEALQIPTEDVEMWVIDVVRAGLIEGKLSQQRQELLIHRSTYRVFGTKQWNELDGRLSMWKNSLVGVLDVIRAEKESLIQQREQESRAAEAKANGLSGMAGGRNYGRAARQAQQSSDIMDAGFD